MVISKVVKQRNGTKKSYTLYDKYYTEEEAQLKAKQMRDKAKMQGRKIRTYVEEMREYGSIAELFIPGTKWYLWVNED